MSGSREYMIVPAPDCPAERYSEELGKRISASLANYSHGIMHLDARVAEVIIKAALHLASEDIAAGHFVPLEHLGEFVAVDNRGPMIRYQADRRLLESCAIANLKQGVSRHGKK